MTPTPPSCRLCVTASAASPAGPLVPDELADALRYGVPDPSAPAAVLVDLEDPISAGLLASTVRAARCSARVLIGVAERPVPRANVPLAQALTLSFAGERDGAVRLPAFVGAANPMAAAQQIADVSAQRPGCTSALAVLLQQTALLPVWEGLVAESATYSTLLAGPEFAAWLASSPPRAPAPDGDEPLLVERLGDVLTLTLNRPDRRNAYGHAVRDALVSALQIALVDPAVRVELRGVGPAFCSGGDLAEFGTAPDAATAHLIRLRHSAGQLLHDLADRVTAYIHGACIGAGIELPAYAGRVIAAADTRMALPEISMGLVPGAGGTVSLVRRIGRWRTAWMALTGASLDVEQALRWGLVDEIAR
jgi:Enoyl-CoA hydratase/isomerase